jgi:Family of unknown function (DUF5763)
MLYRPKYCCSCGEEIERDDWRLWTSRRFCALCETEYKPYDLLPRVIVIAGLAFVLFGIGSYFRSSEPVPVQQVSTRSARPSQRLKPAALHTLPEGQAPLGTIGTEPMEGNSQINEQPEKEKRTSDESVLYCGAITKKGTPCTRRVKKQGFCWQHAKSSQIAPARF